MTHRTQEIILTYDSQFIIMITTLEQPVQEQHRARKRVGGALGNFYGLSGPTTLPAPPSVHQHRSSRKFPYIGIIGHWWSLVTSD
jgi:hypothetical protein